MTNGPKTVEQLIAEEREAHRAHEATTTFMGFTIAELRAAFEAVQHPENWKLRVTGIIPLADYEVTAVAVEFFAGSPLEILYTEPESFGPGRRCFVSGPGYYKCVGS